MHGMKFGKCTICKTWVKWITYFDCKKAKWEYHYFNGARLIDDKPYCQACIAKAKEKQ